MRNRTEWLQAQRSGRAGGRRRGITLFEVVLALAIFVGAFAAISQVLRTGSRASIRAQLTSEAVIRCDRKLNELLAGIIPLQAASQTPFEDNAQWVWTVTLGETETPGLLRAEMLVEHPSPRAGSHVQVHLVRLIRDPQIYIAAAAAKAAKAEEEKK